MSRKTVYQDNRLTIVRGIDHMLGEFIQIFDKQMEDETPEGEGLVFDWSEGFGAEINLTGEPFQDNPLQIVIMYIKKISNE